MSKSIIFIIFVSIVLALHMVKMICNDLFDQIMILNYKFNYDFQL
jgi:hypothetical protein